MGDHDLLLELLLILGMLALALGWNRFWRWYDARPPKPIRLRVGDKLPPGFDEKTGNIGAMIKVCPECTRIDVIYFN